MKLRKEKNGFTLIELLVVVAIISVLIALLLPALSSAREQAWKVECMSNLGQIGKALYGYGEENAGCLPPYWVSDFPLVNWVTYLTASRYYPDTSAFPKCKTFVRKHNVGFQTYGLNEEWAAGYKGGPRYDSGPKAVDVPSKTCVVYETDMWGGAQWRMKDYSSRFWDYPDYLVHGRGSNYLYFDWHVEWCRAGGPYPYFLNPPFDWAYKLPPAWFFNNK
jgi:prepilin-type N-terminal cleavage/methylation domain-containing protein/prepilin-type processing-associated H-X9-DG protein